MRESDFRPAYRKIADDILNGILTGVYGSGDKIPTQAELAASYSVSRITVRDAVNELIHKGFLYTRQGKGTYVGDMEKFSYPLSRTESFSAGIATAGKILRTEVLDKRYVAADKSLAKKLGIPEGLEVLYLRRLRIVENIPIVVTSSYLDRSYFDRVDFEKEDFARNSLYDTLKKQADLVIDYADEEIRAVRCPRSVAGYLELEEGEPVLYIKRRTVDDGEICFEWGEQFERTDFSGMKIRSHGNR